MLLTKPDKPVTGGQKARSFDEIVAMLDGVGSKTASGVYVNSFTAMQQATVWACVRIISEIVAQLPIEVQVRQGGGWQTAEQHDAVGLLAEPNDLQTQHDLISTLVAWSELHGNGHLYKNRNGAGKIMRLLPLETTNVSTSIDANWRLSYSLSGEDGPTGEFGPDRIFHLRNFGLNGYLGLSTISQHKENIGLAKQLENHAVGAFKNGLQGNKWVKLEAALKDQELEAFKTALAEYQGAINTGKMPVLTGGASIESTLQMSAVDAQYIESRRLQKQELASIFGVPLFLLNDTEKSTTWGTGLEQLSRSFVRFSLNPRLNRISQTLLRELILPADRQKTRFIFDTDNFTLGEFKERMEGYRSGIESGVLNPNECREIEGRAPRTEGEKYRLPTNIGIEGQQNAPQTPDAPADD